MVYSKVTKYYPKVSYPRVIFSFFKRMAAIIRCVKRDNPKRNGA